MKKKPLNKEVRFALIGVVAALIVISAFFAYTAFNTPTTYQKEVTLLEYQHKANFSHSVYLKPNPLYNKDVISGKDTYFNKITDHIQINLDYKFDINKEANADTECNVNAVLSTDKWSKSYSIDNKNSDPALSFSIPINVSQYSNQVKKIEKGLGVFSKEAKLKLTFDIHTVANTEYGKIDEKISPTASISLGNTYSISEDGVSESGSITTQKTVEREGVAQKRITYSSLAGILILGALVFTLTTENTEEDEDLKTLKKYQKWIVNIENVPSGEIMPVDSFDDLVTVAGELGKPICKKDSEYYVIDKLIYKWSK